MQTIVLGQTYRDRVSGWTGVAVARHEYLNGCVRYELAASDKDGKPESFVFDEQQIVSIDAPDGRRLVPGDPESSAPHWPVRPGGPRDNAPVPFR